MKKLILFSAIILLCFVGVARANYVILDLIGVFGSSDYNALLLETGGYLLLESGDKLLLE